jgi:hypothetical protein
METKKCFKCGKIKPLSDFYKHSQMADGHVNKCKECNKKDVRYNYRTNVDYFKEYDRKRAMLPHRVKARKEYQQTVDGKKAVQKAHRKYRENQPLKYIAKNMLNNAVRDGRIIKQPCQVCGSTFKTHGHHDDYYKPLEVKWFCDKHHKEYHKNNINNLQEIKHGIKNS